MKRTKSIAKWAIPVTMTLLPFFVMAALVNPTATLTGRAVTLDEIENLISGIARFLIVISIVVAVIFIVYGGIRWIMARDDDEAATKAKSMIMNGIWGALVVLGVGVILQTLAGVVARTFFGGFQ